MPCVTAPEFNNLESLYCRWQICRIYTLASTSGDIVYQTDGVGLVWFGLEGLRGIGISCAEVRTIVVSTEYGDRFGGVYSLEP